MKQLIFNTRPGYDCRNRCSFNRFLKVSRDGAEVTSEKRTPVDVNKKPTYYIIGDCHVNNVCP